MQNYFKGYERFAFVVLLLLTGAGILGVYSALAGLPNCAINPRNTGSFYVTIEAQQ